MQIGVPKHEDVEEEAVRTGVVSFFNDAKGFGFIKDKQTGESVFVHVNQLTERITENDKVNFEVEMGHKGPSAINVKKIV
jgi:cold shock CspA family protein